MDARPRIPARLGCVLLGAALLAAALGACLPAFAPAVRTRGHHAFVEETAPDATCLRCHPSARSPAFPQAEATVPMVPAWMLDDPRGCVGCHAVRGVRR